MSGQGFAGSMGVARRDEVARRNGLARRDEPAWRVHAAGVAPLIAALGLVGACSSSPPTHFYTLSDTAPEAAAPAGVGSPHRAEPAEYRGVGSLGRSVG